MDALGAPHVGERTEKELITAFCDKIAERDAELLCGAVKPTARLSLRRH